MKKQILEQWVYDNLERYGNCGISESLLNKHGEEAILQECRERGYLVEIELNENVSSDMCSERVKVKTCILNVIAKISDEPKKKAGRHKKVVVQEEPKEESTDYQPIINQKSTECQPVDKEVDKVDEVVDKEKVVSYQTLLDAYEEVRKQLTIYELKDFLKTVQCDVTETEFVLNAIQSMSISDITKLFKGEKLC